MSVAASPTMPTVSRICRLVRRGENCSGECERSDERDDDLLVHDAPSFLVSMCLPTSTDDASDESSDGGGSKCDPSTGVIAAMMPSVCPRRGSAMMHRRRARSGSAPAVWRGYRRSAKSETGEGHDREFLDVLVHRIHLFIFLFSGRAHLGLTSS